MSFVDIRTLHKPTAQRVPDVFAHQFIRGIIHTFFSCELLLFVNM